MKANQQVKLWHTYSWTLHDTRQGSSTHLLILNCSFGNHCPRMMMYKIFDWHQYNHFFAVECAIIIESQSVKGAQIIDLMMLVVEVTKGMQTQTAECLIIGQITCNKMVVVLNKIDLIPENKREAVIEKVCLILISNSGKGRFNYLFCK